MQKGVEGEPPPINETEKYKSHTNDSTIQEK